jgi:hypothetical protein
MYRTTSKFVKGRHLPLYLKASASELSPYCVTASFQSTPSAILSQNLPPVTNLFYKEFHQSSFLNNKRPSFFGNILENIKQEYSKNQELQESLKKFREDAKKLEESKELRDARKKFETIEGTNQVKHISNPHVK